MSVVDIINKFIKGDVAKKKLVILEGWDIGDVANYLDAKKIYSKDDVLAASKKDFSVNFSFLKNKSSLEGYIFPDTYLVPVDFTADDFLKMTLNNFDKRLTPELRQEIARQKKTVSEVITMASILEKEVRSLDDKKVVSGILWKRISYGMPLQVDSTVNYVTGKNDASVALKDLKIDSKYNTYKYLGLPSGPISNPGMDSILAAIYPVKSQYWYYLSATATGKTVYSKTFSEHSLAIGKYLR